jgi:hypothetical protein
MKICSKCGEPKDESEFYTHKGTSYGKPPYLIAMCKVCCIKKSNEWQREHPDKVLIKNKRWQEKNSDRMKKYYHQYNEEHQEQRYENSHNHYLKYIEKYHDKSKRWYLDHPDKGKEYVRKYIKNNPEKVAESQRKWKSKNLSKLVVIGQRYRANKKHAPINDFTDYDWNDLLFIYDHRCAYCRKDEIKAGGLTQDHVIPLSRSGNHSIDNIVPSCRSCNSRKKDKTLEEWHMWQNRNSIGG